MLETLQKITHLYRSVLRRPNNAFAALSVYFFRMVIFNHRIYYSGRAFSSNTPRAVSRSAVPKVAFYCDHATYLQMY
jgi:hypothetical protein